MCGMMGEHFLCISEISLLITKRWDCQLSKFRGKSVCYEFKISVNKNGIENKVRDRSQVQQEKKKRSVSLICLHYKIFSLIYIKIILLGVQAAHSTKAIRYGIIFVNCFIRRMYVFWCVFRSPQVTYCHRLASVIVRPVLSVVR